MSENIRIAVLGKVVADNPYELAVNNGIFNGTLEEWLLSLEGKDGLGIKSFDLIQTTAIENTYKMTFTDNTATDIVIKNGINGINGRGIVSMTRTSSKQLIDTYTITYTDDTTQTIEVVNGRDGAPGNGITNIAYKETIGLFDTYVVTYTDSSKYEYQVKNGADGVSISDIKLTNTEGIYDTYTIMLSNGKSSQFTITNGKDGSVGNGIKSVILEKSVDNVDTYLITFTDKSEFRYTITNGKDGKINGYNEIKIIEGNNIKIVQNGSEMTIHAISNNEWIPIAENEFPIDFPRFTVVGEGKYDGNFFVTPHTTKTFENNYIFIINNQGHVLKYKKIPNQAYDFKKVYNSLGQERYTYLDVISKDEPTEDNVGFYENSELVILDEKFEEIDRVRNNKAGEIREDYPAENHFSLFIDDGHYIIASYFKPEGSDRYENSIQELKWNRVLWHLETNDIPELANLSHTSSTTDYAHINAMEIDYDGNFIISFRNIGIVKLNKSTKEIMWVIGRRRNDFDNITTSQIPFQQHDIRIYKGDGSISVFDNYGHTNKSRICRYYLDEINMKCSLYKEYITTKNRSNYMGSAQLINDENDTFVITYGSGWDYGFEEYDFKNKVQNMQLTFNDGHDVYNVTKDINNLKASYKGDVPNIEDPTTPDNPEISYALYNETFDGTRYIDTGIKLFDEPKDFTIILKWQKSEEDIEAGKYAALLHNLKEINPWEGLTIQSFRQSGTSGTSSIALHLNDNTQIKYHSTLEAIQQVAIRFITIARKSNGETIIKYIKEDGNVIIDDSFVNTFITGEYQNQNMILGAADMGDYYDRFFKGKIELFNYFEKYLTEEEVTSIINDNIN